MPESAIRPTCSYALPGRRCGVWPLLIAVLLGIEPSLAFGADERLVPHWHLWVVCLYGVVGLHGASRISPWFALALLLPPVVYLTQPLTVLHDPMTRAAAVRLGPSYAVECYLALALYVVSACACLATSPVSWWQCWRDDES